MPLRHASRHIARGQARRRGELREAEMTHLPLSRRDLLKGAGALVVALHLPAFAEAASDAAAGKPPLAADQLDSWIAVRQDGSVLAFFGKMDMGQGVDVAIGQIVAEELDVDFKRVSVLMGDTATSVNQGRSEERRVGKE